MLNDYGFESAQWDAARQQAKAILVDVATRKGRIAYSELVGQISALRLEPHDARLFHLLGEISSDEDKAGRGMLSAIVVHKSGDMQPGPGFFELARSLGRNTTDPLVCWISEFNKVHDYWANRHDRA
ncbi:TPA: hypothetical protein ACKP0F_000282 [Stenotrophomonas maltophilia]|jgi:hypothetical protein|nr:hypothetical protein [Stenotrophomonas maltophilia]HDS1229905.1 hypothetical protein [Stenotrophomonas maltophilia]